MRPLNPHKLSILRLSKTAVNGKSKSVNHITVASAGYVHNNYSITYILQYFYWTLTKLPTTAKSLVHVFRFVRDQMTKTKAVAITN